MSLGIHKCIYFFVTFFKKCDVVSIFTANHPHTTPTNRATRWPIKRCCSFRAYLRFQTLPIQWPAQTEATQSDQAQDRERLDLLTTLALKRLEPFANGFVGIDHDHKCTGIDLAHTVAQQRHLAPRDYDEYHFVLGVSVHAR